MINSTWFRCTVGIVLILLMILNISFALNHTEKTEANPYLTHTCGENTVFTDNINGYRIKVPGDITVDDSRAEICMMLENDNLNIKVFREDFSSEAEIDSSIYYSNRFLENNELFPRISHHEEKLLNFEITYDVWSRDAFSVIPDDKCYYACASYKKLISQDVHTAYTLLIQYNDTVSFESDILPIINSFRETPQCYSPETIVLGKTSSTFADRKTQQFYDTTFGSSSNLTWGIFDQRDIIDTEAMQNFETEINYHFPIRLFYTDFNDAKEPNTGKRMLTFVKNACQNGDIPELTLQTAPTEDGSNQVLETLQGKYDTFLHNYACFVADLQQPVLFRLCNEMNGDWCVYSAFYTCRDADIYCDFYRYVYGIFEAEGADNAIWVWNPNHRSFPNYKWNHEIMYYPGDDYVDIVGLTAYNTGNYYEGESWHEFSELYNDLYNTYCQRYRQPLMITEFASSSYGGDKAQWLKNMFRDIQTYSRIKVAIWWNGCDMDGNKEARPYYINEQNSELEVFKEGISE